MRIVILLFLVIMFVKVYAQNDNSSFWLGDSLVNLYEKKAINKDKLGTYLRKFLSLRRGFEALHQGKDFTKEVIYKLQKEDL